MQEDTKITLPIEDMYIHNISKFYERSLINALSTIDHPSKIALLPETQKTNYIDLSGCEKALLRNDRVA
jgi:hypothetical protein